MKRFPLPSLIAIAASAAVLSVSAWAAEIVPGVPNFYRVNAHVLRGGQPEDQAWANLARMGVRTVIDLRREGEHSTAAEAKAVEAAGMRYVNFPMNGFETPQASQILKVLELLARDDTVFVHCKLGMDRTGTVIAAYRIAQDKWEAERALDEAEACGLHWFERGMKRFIRTYKTTPLAPQTLAAEPGVAPTPSSQSVSAEAVGR